MNIVRLCRVARMEKIMSKTMLHIATICTGCVIGYLIPTMDVFGSLLLCILVYSHLAGAETPIRLRYGGQALPFLVFRVSLYITAFITMKERGTETFIIACLFFAFGAIAGIVSYSVKKLLSCYFERKAVIPIVEKILE